MKRIISMILFLSLLLSCFCGVTLAEDSEKLKVIYIPIDDRPFNDERAELLGLSLEMELIMPEESLFSTTLDGQTEEGCCAGDRGALLEWLMANEDSADVLVLSLDQLLSGGLLSSRCISEMDPVTLPDGTVMTETDIIDYIAELASEKDVYIIDSVFRLASSFGYGGYTITDYYLTRMYGLVDRPILTGEDLTIDNIVASYRLSADGSPAYLHAGMSQEQIEYFLSPWNVQEDESSDPDVEEDPEADSNTEGDSGEEDSGTLPDAEAVEEPELLDEAEAVWEYIQRMEPEAFTAVMMTTEEPVEAVEEDPNSLLSNYLAVRQRKLTLTAYALEKLTPISGVRYILGVDDSADGEHLQSNEIRYFEQFMGGDDQIFSAMDGLGQLALTKCYQESCGASARVSITYFGYCKYTINDFNYKSNSENVAQLLNYFGCTEVTESPDLSVLIYCGASNERVRYADLYKLVNQLNENEADGIPTVLVDVTGTGRSLMSELPVDSVHLGMLMAYSGKTENPGQVHMAMVQGLARYFSLSSGRTLSDTAQISHLENLLSALVEEIYDTSQVSANMYQFIGNLGQSDPLQNVSEELLDLIYGELNQQMTAYCSDMLESFTSSNFIVSMEPYTLSGITEANISDVEYPWLRQFEIWGNYTCGYGESANDTGVLHRASINGVSWTEFDPTGMLTRDMAAKMLMSVSQQPIDENIICPFDDVADWAEIYVANAAHKGYILGCDDGSFQGSRNMTRAEFAVLLVQYVNAEGIALERVQEAEFKDLNRTKMWYSDEVYLLADCGIIRGFLDGSFRPDSEITRAEAVTMFARLFGRDEALPDSLKEIPRFADVSVNYWAYEAIQEASISHFLIDN